VCAIVGDGDFLQTVQELATAVQYDLPVLVVVCNNMGWQSITDLQIDAYGAESDYATRFMDRHGRPVSPHLADIASAFGARGIRLETPQQISETIRRGLELRQPTVVEVLVARDLPRSAGVSDGWWDVPVPGYLPERRAAYERGRGGIQ
jgi:acetolactate synthase-1/2/3 large subunit